jgi:hypothetical protein
MSTKTSNLCLIKPELTDAADITGMNSNWDKLDEQITLLSSGASKSVIVEATISASNWQSNLYTWRNSGITSTTQIVELLPSQSITEEQLEALQSANIVGNSQSVGSITFKAYGDVPTIDIPVIFIIRGDA